MSQPDYGQQPYEQQPYGQPQGYGYGQPQPYGQPGYGMAAEHPQASTVQILGILGIFFGIVAFVAWYLGGQAKKEIEAGAPYPWDGKVKLGYTLGKVFSIIYISLAALYIVFVVFALVFGIAAAAGS